MEHAWPSLKAGRVRPEVFASFDPGAAPAPHRLMESNQHIGRIVIDCSQELAAVRPGPVPMAGWQATFS